MRYTKNLIIGIPEAGESGSPDAIKFTTTTMGTVILSTEVPKTNINVDDLEDALIELRKFITENCNKEETPFELSSEDSVTIDEIPF